MTEVTVWSGFVGGLAVGLYALAQLILTGQPLGVSTGYGNLCALASKRPFFSMGVYAKPTNWRLWFVLGLPLGGLLAAMTSPGAIVPSFSLGALYDSVLPASFALRALALTIGGAMMGYGARLAGGCTSGHAIAGISLLNRASVLAAACFFAGGVVMVQLLFGLRG